MCGEKVPLSSKVGEANRPEEIATLFMFKQMELMNGVGKGRSCHNELLTNHQADISYSTDNGSLDRHVVKMVFAKLKLRKASGPNGPFPNSTDC